MLSNISSLGKLADSSWNFNHSGSQMLCVEDPGEPQSEGSYKCTGGISRISCLFVAAF